MTVPMLLLRDPEEIGAAVARLIIDRYRSRPGGRRFLLGCPGGRSLDTSYRHLAEAAARTSLDLCELVIVMMDEYVHATDAGFVAVDPSLPHSCQRFGREEILGRLNAGRAVGEQVPPENLWLPDPGEPAAYDERIAAAGGIDLFLLASGAGDGHVAFNPPGTDPTARTRVVALPESTRRDNLATFPTFEGRLAAVPAYGVTVGVDTIRELSAETVMVVHGPDKVRAAEQLTSATRYRPEWPATILVECRSPSLFLDRAAAAGLPVAVTAG